MALRGAIYLWLTTVCCDMNFAVSLTSGACQGDEKRFNNAYDSAR